MKATLITLVTMTLGAAACAPNTVIRRTAFIPAATAPVRAGLPLDKGEIRLEGHANAINSGGTIHDGDWLFDEFPDVGDPGVLIPDVHLGASLYFGLPKGVELGFQLGYAAMDWSHRNAIGVLPFPEHAEEDLFMGGVGIRYTIPLDSREVSLSLMGQLDLVTIPQAVFVCVDSERCTADQWSGDFEAEDIYRFERIDEELFMLPNVAIQLGWKAMPELMPYLFLGAQASVKNTGFEDDPTSLPEDTLETMFVGYIGIGVDADIEGFVIGGSFYLPLEAEDRIDFGPSVALKLGARFGGKKRDRDEPPAPVEPAPVEYR
ncbi:MAG: hypothetical protein IT385_01035 [Deltaproteobacteria bacterium]|nr:hypothetical protein [Deltaproteobacteria bacterium]